MNLLIMHPNFPAQFLYLAQYFARSPRNRVVFLTKETNGNRLKNVTIVGYKPKREPTQGVHPYVRPMEQAVLDGQATLRAAVSMQEKIKFRPDVIIGHTGWGSTLYMKDIYPEVPLIGYFEWYYHAKDSDMAWWPDEKPSIDDMLRLRTLNAHHLVNLQACDVRYTPTQWQKSQFPPMYQEGMHVIHEGVDVDFCRPNPGAKLVLKDKGLDLSDAEEIITYVSRGFEPYRGFPQFMEAIRIVLGRRKKTHVVLVGMDRTCYGAQPPKGKTWKGIEEERGGYDKERVHFVGHLHRLDYQKVLQASTVHVYLTRPFVLSWSMIESMSFGCALVGSKTPPVEEVVVDGENGLLANFRQPEHIAQRIEELLDDPALRARLGKAARETVLARYNANERVKELTNLIYGAMR